MQTAVIISEYNPFHLGHESLVTRIREQLGPDTRIVALLSELFTQRGDPALFSDRIRAEAAVRGGVDLVLSLPLPYCLSGAEIFARTGVYLASALFPGSYLAFGAECADLKALQTVTDRLDAPEFRAAVAARSSSEPLAVATERVYAERFGSHDTQLLRSPNNILAVCYLRAISDQNAALTPLPFSRVGSAHDCRDADTACPSAAALRELLRKEDTDSFYQGVPDRCAEIYRNAVANGEYAAHGWDRISSAVLYRFRCSDEADFAGFAEMNGGLDRRILQASRSATDTEDLFRKIATKRYTDARIRRAVLAGMLGIRKEDADRFPDRVRLLAANAAGTALLRSCVSDPVRIVTRPKTYCETPDRISALHLAAQALWDLTLEKPRGAEAFFTVSPIRLD